jgi:hypothetical protein
MKKLWPILLLFVAACKQKEYNADLLVKNAVVYTVDSAFTTANAFVVNAGKIVAVGDAATLENNTLPMRLLMPGAKLYIPVLLMPMPIFMNMVWACKK